MVSRANEVDRVDIMSQIKFPSDHNLTVLVVTPYVHDSLNFSEINSPLRVL